MGRLRVLVAHLRNSPHGRRRGILPRLEAAGCRFYEIHARSDLEAAALLCPSDSSQVPLKWEGLTVPLAEPGEIYLLTNVEVAIVPTAAEPAPPAANSADRSLVIDLHDPVLAAFLAWLIPGAGHFYQRRWGKGGLFMICILGTFFMGLWMGQGKVVYASWRHNDQRYAYFCQLGVGLPALPALVQSVRMGSDSPRSPLFGGLEAPPLMPEQIVPVDWALEQVAEGKIDKEDFPELAKQPYPAYVSYLYSPLTRESSPKLGAGGDPYNQTSDWNFRMGPFFELGTVYTLIAGLLNVLAIYDAWGGPVLPLAESNESAEEKKK